VSHTSLPPVPQRLRDMLKDSPEHIHRLQADLNRVVEEPFEGPPMLEQAVWAMEDALHSFFEEARKELCAAEASGDPDAIERATAKTSCMSRIRSKMVWLEDTDFSDYFRLTDNFYAHR